MTACVYVLHRLPDTSGRIVLPLKICRDAAEAQTLAHAVRDIFACPAWVEDFDVPANVRTFQVRAMEAVRQAVRQAAPDARRI